MSVQSPPAAPPALSGVRVRFSGVLASEWVKLRSVRSTVWTLLTTALIMVLLGFLIPLATTHRPAGARHEVVDPLGVSLAGIFFAQIALGVLGALVVTAEYSTGSIRSTLAAVPRRLPVLVAKVIVFAVVAAVVSAVAVLAAFLVGQAVLSSKSLELHLSTPGVPRVLVSAVAYLVFMGLIGMGLGAILRSTAPSIVALVALVFVLPLIGAFFSSGWEYTIQRYLPSQAGQAALSLTRGANSLSAGAGITVLGLYALVLLVVGAVLLRRRDA